MVNCAGPPENFAVWSACTPAGLTVWAAVVVLAFGWMMLDVLNNEN